MEKAIKIIKERRKGCLKHLRFLESKLGDEKYHKDNYIDDDKLNKEIEEFDYRIQECDVILRKIKNTNLLTKRIVK